MRYASEVTSSREYWLLSAFVPPMEFTDTADTATSPSALTAASAILASTVLLMLSTSTEPAITIPDSLPMDPLSVPPRE